MSKRFCFIFCLAYIINTCSVAQQIINGRIYDSLTRRPVSYATVSTQSTSVYCDSLGFFELKNTLDENASITCVGYKTKHVRMRKGICDTFYLSPIFKQLAPVSVGQYPWLKNPSIQLGKIEGKSKFAVNVASGLTFLKYFDKPDKTKKYIIGTLSIRVNNPTNIYEPRKVRVRVFEVQKGMQIGEDILNVSDIFLIDKIVDNVAHIQLNKFFLEMPDNGCFIGLEFIRNGFEANKSDYTGFLAIKGWLSKSFEDGPVFSKYFSNTFREFVFGPTQKVNLYCSLTLYEK
jgi:hypothetical protein